jgi:hypothetical protein
MLRTLLLLAVFSGLSMSCDGILSVNGRVVDDVGTPVPAATISVYSGYLVAVGSDEHGCFRLVKMTTWSNHEAPLLVEAEGHQTYRGTVKAPGGHLVVIHLPREGGAQQALMEKVASDASCPAPNLGAAQHGVEPAGRSPAAPARGLTP